LLKVKGKLTEDGDSSKRREKFKGKSQSWSLLRTVLLKVKGKAH
jgi:hypothetical protein